MTDSQCIAYLENICKMFVNGSKNCEGSALVYQQMYISAIQHAIAKLQSGAGMRGDKRMTNKEAIANLNHIYGMVAPDIQRSLDVAIKALEERPQGEWIYDSKFLTVGSPDSYKCSNCGMHTDDEEDNFCWFCGADMRGGTE